LAIQDLRRGLKHMGGQLGLAALIALGAGQVMAQEGTASSEGKVKSFEKCPSSPNCVTSLGPVGDHYVSPLAFSGDAHKAWDVLQEVIAQQPRWKVEESNAYYIHIVATTEWLRFDDDVLLYLNTQESRIEVRSASRVGYSDLGANRKRVEALREAFSAALEAAQ